MLIRRKSLQIVSSALAMPFVSRRGLAQSWPTRPVTMIVAFAAGGPTDVMSRLFASAISEKLGQQIVVENVPGGGGMAGALRVATAAPDGYVFLSAGIATLAQIQNLYERLAYNALTDFEPVGLVAELARVLIVRKDLPVSNLAEFITYAKANHAKMQFGSGGAGSGPHVCAELLNSAMGIRITHVPYRGSGPAMNDLIAGRIDFQCEQLSTALPQIEGGKVKAIATLAPTRSPVFENLPTAHEQGLTDFDCTTWQAFVFPKGTPRAIVARLARATSDAMETQALRERMIGFGGTVIAPNRRGPEYFAKFLVEEVEKWGKVIRAANIKAE
jgi:tripartite-type tricarboxylate transporter receptor subunit TctC